MIPTNEIETIVLFAQQAGAESWEIIRIRATFPDAIVVHEGQPYRAEFEFKAMNFSYHGHDSRECDLIICWENNWPDAPLPVISGADGWKESTDVSLIGRLRKERNYWRRRAFRAEAQIEPQSPTLVISGVKLRLPIPLFVTEFVRKTRDRATIKVRAYLLSQEFLTVKTRNLGGRPRIPIDPKKVAYYIAKGPGNVSRKEAREKLGLGQPLHIRHKVAAQKTIDAEAGNG